MARRKDHISTLIAGALVVAALGLFATPAFAWFEVPESARDSGAVHEGKPRVDARLVTDARQVAPGETFRVGVAFSLDTDWHIYWQNPGDAGVPTDIQWGGGNVEFGPLKWSAPKRFTESGGDLTVFGYEDRVILFSEATVDEGASGQIEVTAAADYLACRSACMPGEARLQRTIPVGAETVRAESDVLSALDRYSARVPRPASEYDLETEVAYSTEPLAHESDFEAALAIEACGEAEKQCAGWEPVWESRPHAFVPDDVSGAEVRVEQVREHPDAETGWVYHLSGTVRSADENIKEQLSGVVRFQNAEGTTIPVHVQEPLPIAEPGQQSEPTGTELLEVSTPTVSASAANSPGGGGGGGPPSLLWVLLMAFVGGAILNLMPCVFPVLALKVTSFNRTVRESRGSILAHGAAYTAGIVGSLLALGLVVVGLRTAGHQVGWGFQFQHPAFPAALAAVVTLFALNLFGLFDVNLQSGDLQETTEEASGIRRSVGEGVLAVVLATPCSAPFLGTAVGFAFASNAFTILAVFATLGLGLAAPFVVLTLMPGWAKLLPKPGAWMGHLKHFLGFALIGTAGWLVWLVGRQAGVDAMASVLGLLIVVGMAAWIFGLVQYGSSALKKWGWTAAAGMLVVGTAGWVFPLDTGESGSSSRAAAESDQQGAVDWQKWSREAVQKHLEEGRPVFVDFTADWCLTCQVNEQNAITASSVLEAVDEHDVAMLKADWTDGSERIRKELQRHGRAGVPMYLVYSPEAPNDPELLPEVLTTDHLTTAFEKAAGEDDE
jgi:thiol:disulfide interchange protein DsbD